MHLQCGFVAYHYITVVLVQGFATTCWRQIQKEMFVYSTTVCVAYSLIYSWYNVSIRRYVILHKCSVLICGYRRGDVFLYVWSVEPKTLYRLSMRKNCWFWHVSIQTFYMYVYNVYGWWLLSAGGIQLPRGAVPSPAPLNETLIMVKWQAPQFCE